MNIAASTSVCTDAKWVGFPRCPQGWPQPSFPGPEAKDCLRGAEKFALGGWRLGLPSAGAPHNLGFCKGNNTFPTAGAPPFILPL